MPEASVVIATRDRAAMLEGCLTTLLRQSAAGRFEIIVVDNGSSDATPRVIAELRATAASVDTMLHSLSVAEPNRAKARNAAIARAAGDIVIFCDDDTIVPEHFVARHLDEHKRPQRVVSGPIVNVDDAHTLPAPGARHYSRAFFCTCNVSVHRSELEAAGGFDERYDLYGWEDTDLGIRLKARGLGRVFCRQAYIYHVKPKTTSTLARRRALAVEKGKMAGRFVHKSPSWPVRLATGAYAANFARARLFHARPLRALYEQLAAPERGDSALKALATEALVDAAYVDALRAALDPHA